MRNRLQTRCKARVDDCYGIIKRAFLNPAIHLVDLRTASSMSMHKLTYQYAWLRHRQSIYSIVNRVITLISSENGGMNNLAIAFPALPGGYRNNSNGNYNNMGNNGYFWSSTEHGGNDAWSRRLYYGNSGVGRGGYNKEYGFSVRCIRD